MTDFDSVQQQVLALDASRNARVLGAPGSGKTTLLIESFARLLEQPGWVEGDVLALAPSRLVASRLRRAVERRLDRAVGGTPVRTATSLAFSLLQRRAALRGSPAPRLLTGTVQDEVSAQVVDEVLSAQLELAQPLPFVPEVLQGEAFRGELRELNRVLDDFGLRPEELSAQLSGTPERGAGGALETGERASVWQAALELSALVRERLERERPGELSSSAMMRSACAAVRDDDGLAIPRIVLVDDAGELGEGALALLAALVARGARVWAFGDPDIATSAFQGERVRVLAGVNAELRRRGVPARAAGEDEQLIVLDRVYRHGAELRGLVRGLTERIGTAGAGQQRAASAVAPGGGIQFARVGSSSEQIGALAYRLRARRLGLGGAAPMPWSRMAVICRTRSEAKRVARQLAAQQVPSGVAAGGVVLREHQLVRELIRLLQHALGIAPLTAREVGDLLGGAVGGLDPIGLRRLRGALRLNEARHAREDGRPAEPVDELLLEAFEFPARTPVLDMRGARRLDRLGTLAAAARTAHEAGRTPREVLWRLWEGSGLAGELQRQALDGRGARSDEAHRTLDAVLGLFFALQRHEEQDSDRGIEALLDDLLLSAVPEDSLAARSERDSVTVTTAQAVVGREFELVCVLGLQDGAWPNLRSRGSLLGVTALERLLRGGEATTPSRRDTMHDELRLFAHAVARAGEEVLVLAISNEDEHPSAFFGLGGQFAPAHSLPSARLTLRGAVAEMRRRLVQDPGDAEALHSLLALAGAGVPGAHPDDWYGVRELSTEAPLVDIEHEPDASVRVSPSQMERAEQCPLDWIVSRLGGSRSDYRASLGTLVHHALETLQPDASTEEILEVVRAEWGSLQFDAGWQEQRAEAEAEAMAGALSSYLYRFQHSGQRLLATEADFSVPIEFASLRGSADRLEGRVRDDGTLEITVVDLKTGRRKPSASELEEHAQLQAYQLGVLREAFLDEQGDELTGVAAGAKLVYIHPDTVNKTQQKRGEKYTEVAQEGLSERAQRAFEARVLEIGRVMAAGSFVARVEHHCENPNSPGRSCALHIIPAVSHA